MADYILSTCSQEFDILDDDANIYKQIGPVLLKQDKTEAVMAVNGRLEFIDKEMYPFLYFPFLKPNI